MRFVMNLTKKMLLSACILASGITNTVVCAELISHTPYAKTMAASIVDSFERGKASRAFMTAMKSQDVLRTGFGDICKKSDLQMAEQEFFSALAQVFSGEVPNVTDSAVDLILESAQRGYVDANDIVKFVSGGKTIAEIEKSSYPTLKMTIKQRLQGFIDESSSDNEDSMSDTESDDGSIDVSRKAEPLSDEDLEDDYPFKQLQEHMFLGVTSYLKNIHDQDAKKIVTGTLDRMLACPDCTNEELLDEIFPLSESESSKPFYDELSRKILKRK